VLLRNLCIAEPEASPQKRKREINEENESLGNLA
jgi:hypothetical protein